MLLEVLRAHPALAGYDARRAASRFRTRDRLRRPNPELELDAGSSGSFDELVGGVELALPLRPGGEAAALREAGGAELAVIDADCRIAAAALLAGAAAAWTDLLAAADARDLADEELEVARGFLDHARRRAEMAMGGDLPVLHAEILAQRALARRESAEADARAARARLATLLGRPADAAVPEPDSTAASRSGQWELLVSLPAHPGGDRGGSGVTVDGAAAPSCGLGDPSVDAPSRRLADPDAAASGEPPAIAAARARLELARREAELVRAGRRPAPRVGVRAERDTGGEFKLLGVAGLAVPLFNRGAEAVAAADAEADAARQDLARDSLAFAGELADALAQHRRAEAALRRLEQGALPMAAALEASARANVERGAAGFVLWLEARRSYLELRDAAIELRARMADAALEVRRATADFGRLLDPAGTSPGEDRR
ncbi:MAG TPA: TolC family protein [Gemmatimonadota bacterium]